MDDRLKRRLIGAAVLASLAVIFVPMLVEEEPVPVPGSGPGGIPPREDLTFRSQVLKDEITVPTDAPPPGEKQAKKATHGSAIGVEMGQMAVVAVVLSASSFLLVGWLRHSQLADTDRALDAQLVHPLLEFESEVDVVDARAGAGVGGQRIGLVGGGLDDDQERARVLGVHHPDLVGRPGPDPGTDTQRFEPLL